MIRRRIVGREADRPLGLDTPASAEWSAVCRPPSSLTLSEGEEARYPQCVKRKFCLIPTTPRGNDTTFIVLFGPSIRSDECLGSFFCKKCKI